MSVYEQLLAKVLSVYYNVKYGGYLLGNVLGYGPDILSVKERKVKPPVLTEGITDHTVKINGINIHYVSCGDESKPLMLFVHGFPEFWYSWRYQLKEFSKDYWCIALDQRGYNESDKPEGLEPYLIQHLVSDINELVKVLGRKQFTLVCHDWGSIVGFEYVMNYMDNIDKYVMLCAPPTKVHRQVSRFSMQQFRMMWYIFFFLGRFVPETILRSFDLRIFNRLKSKSVSNTDIEAYRYVYSQKDAFTPPINYYRANVGMPAKDPPKPSEYKKGLLILAENDLYISTDCGPAAEALIPNLKYVMLEDADHHCQQTSPEDVNNLIRNFLKE